MTIAIIGVASVAPKAKNIHEYWNNIVNGVDCITDVPASRWDADAYYDPDPTRPDKTYSNKGGFIPDIEFDPLEFGLPPNILEVTDSSQLLSLVVAKRALYDAGYGEASDAVRERTGVILGVGGGQKLMAPLISRLEYPVWERALKSSGISDEDTEAIIEKIKLAYVPWEENSFPGLLGNVIAGRVANRLDLGGINCVVDAACAGSLAALQMAISELEAGRADMMITGGVDTDNSIFMYMCFSKTPAFSRQGRIRPFDASSDGMLIGEGVGMYVLKRLEDAERDGDRIYAVIRGIGASSDGRYKSIYAPRPDGQALALRRAYEDAGFSPATVGLIEAHGTGTAAGDLAEFTTLKKVFTAENAAPGSVALGSVKSQIGHTKSAAGAFGMLKAVLALHHKIVPPTLNVSQPHPGYEIDETPFYVNSETRPWVRAAGDAPRRAGVSSFGFGGTNFHVVLEEYEPDHARRYRMHPTAQPVLLSAATPEQLLDKVQQTADRLQGEDASTHYKTLVAESAAGNIPAAHARIGFVAGSLKDARDLLETAARLLSSTQTDAWEHPRGIYYRRQAMDVAGKVVALFSGQGAQYPNMARELALNFPAIRDAYGQMNDLFVRDGAPPLSDVVYPPPAFNAEQKLAQSEALTRTEHAQPAIGALGVGMYRTLTQAGFAANFTAGHSFGELTALWAANVLNDDDYFVLARARGKAMAPPPDPNFDAGTMLAVVGKIDGLETLLARFPDVTIANWNSPRQVVLAGPKNAIAQVQSALSAEGYTANPLPVSAAFHTRLVGHAQQDFDQAIHTATFNAPALPVYANTTGEAYPNDPAAIRQMLSGHILNQVQFKREIENIYAAGGRVFVEFGPRSILTNLVGDILGDRPHLAVALNPSRRKSSDHQLRDVVVRLQVAGLPLGEIDPYQRDPLALQPRRKPRLSVTLNGGNYVSDKTRSAYEKALANGHQIAPVTKAVASQITLPAETAAPPPAVPALPPIAAPPEPVLPPPPPVIPEPVVAQVTATIAPTITPAVAPAMAHSAPGMQPLLDSLAESVGQFSRHQSEILQAHEQYLAGQAEYARLFAQLMQQQQTLLLETGGKLPPAVAESMMHSLTMFHEHQAATLRAHEHYLHDQAAQLQAFLDAMRHKHDALLQDGMRSVERPSSNGFQVAERNGKSSEPLPPPVAIVETIPTPAPNGKVAVADNSALGAALLAIVSEKTGYPAEMLELEMDIEADLGIDSIKRVEILGALREQYPELPQLKPEELGQLRTLGEIAGHLQSHGGSVPAPAVEAAPVAVETAPPVIETTSPNGTVATVAGDTLSTALLEIVSEKTGYPAEMLELEMDIEADLGIDSIKRVEILGALREQYPELPQLKPEELGQLRTLGEIAGHLQLHGGSAPAPAVVETAPVAVQAPSPNGVAAADDTLSTALLDIVSEKTGYPAEMLELEMDIEADLGIDSIKRVEILGALREQYPELPQLKPEELGQLRTLGEIAGHLQSHGGSVPAPAVVEAVPPAVEVTPPSPNGTVAAVAGDTLSTALLDIVSEKTGYPAEMLELEMDIEADLGIDSIKRVEILGALREQYPALPQLKPEELGQLRTLGEIAGHLQSHGGSVPTPVAVEAAPPVIGTASPNGTVAAVAGDTLSTALLEIVSEKTGYPAEMLELEMDIEADLGIDSIKRVEILGALREQYPTLPQLKPEELGQLRTLGEIAGHLQSHGGSAPAPAAVEAVTPAIETASPNGTVAAVASDTLSTALIAIVSEKTGYPAEMLELEMDIEADLGIDSIKRVEILGALREQYPSLPQLKPEELGQLRTLGEIAGHLQSHGGSVAAPVAVEVTPPAIETASPNGKATLDDLPAALDHGIHTGPVRLKFLPRPDFLTWQPRNGDVCLLTDDGTALTASLAGALAQRGWRPVVLSFPESVVEPGAEAYADRIVLADMSEAHLQQALNQVVLGYGPVAAFVHLNPRQPAPNGTLFDQTEKAIVRHVFLMAKHLKPALTGAGAHGRAGFMAVTRLDGELGTTRNGDFGAISGGLYGLVKTLNAEWDNVFCRAVDLAPHLGSDYALPSILAEMHDPNQLITEVGYGDRGRMTLVGEAS